MWDWEFATLSVPTAGVRRLLGGRRLPDADFRGAAELKADRQGRPEALACRSFE